MSEIAEGLSKINGIAASVLQFIPGGQPFAAMAAASAALYGGLAKLTADPPRPPAQLEEVTFGADQPMPFAGGRCMIHGQLIHSEAHGADREGVPNPWRTDTIVLTNDGPVVAIDQLYANKEAVNFSGTTGWETGYYEKYLRADTQLGETPEAAALDWTALDPGDPPAFNEWSSTRKLSGLAAMQFGMLLDAEETHFRSGAPKFSAVGRWAKYYDPRLDSTYSGGVGAHRRDDASTYEYSVNGVIRCLNYALGIYQNTKLVGGGGPPIASIDVPSFVTAANTADANSWACHGVVYENGEDGEIWNNMKLMLQTAAAWPTNDGGVLRCLQRRPLVTVDTIREADIEGPCSGKGMRDWKDGKNTIIPTIVSEANDWSKVPIDAVEVPTLVSSQGEVRSKSQEYPLVTSPTQASQLAVLDIYDTVEIDPIQLTVGRRFIGYNVGDAFDTDLPDLGLVGQTVVMLSKKIDIVTGRVIMGVKTDTTAKHDYALGRTGTAPPQPALATNEELDRAATEKVIGPLRSQALTDSYITGMGSAISATETTTGIWTINVPAHTRVYGNPRTFPSVAVDASSVAGLNSETTYRLYYDDPRLEGGAITMVATSDPTVSAQTETNPYRHFVGTLTTPVNGGTPTNGNPTSPPNTSGPDSEWDGTGNIP